MVHLLADCKGFGDAVAALVHPNPPEACPIGTAVWITESAGHKHDAIEDDAQPARATRTGDSKVGDRAGQTRFRNPALPRPGGATPAWGIVRTHPNSGRLAAQEICCMLELGLVGIGLFLRKRSKMLVICLLHPQTLDATVAP